MTQITEKDNTIAAHCEAATTTGADNIVTAQGYHVPVLLHESIDGLNIQPGGVYVDVTFGGGGPSREILRRLDPTARLFSFDQDATRGFSFRFDAPLDMRMNKRAGMTAADIVNTYSEEQLADVFYLYGELKNARRIAATLAKARTQNAIATTTDFMKAVESLFRREREKKDMAKLFQALRIEVNHEMDALKQMLTAATELLGEGGRLSVITYHSLEDRMVKNIMKTGNCAGKAEEDFFGRVSSPYRLINNKVIVPSDEEQEKNPRSRSAKLRIAEKK